MQNQLYAVRESSSVASSGSPLSSHDPSLPPQSAAPFSRPSRVGLSPPEPAAMSSFYPPHEMDSVSPNEGSFHLGETLRSGGGTSGTPSPAQMSALTMHNSKRAYRQRRKDPSCDACRERKVKVGVSEEVPWEPRLTRVKCDATETSSCTECSSRNVRCQFTKDTNRRMSSIK